MSEDNTPYTREEQENAYTKSAEVKVVVLVKMLKLLDIASSNGVFRGKDMSMAGSTYDSILRGVEAAMSKSRRELRENVNVSVNGGGRRREEVREDVREVRREEIRREPSYEDMRRDAQTPNGIEMSRREVDQREHVQQTNVQQSPRNTTYQDIIVQQPPKNTTYQDINNVPQPQKVPDFLIPVETKVKRDV